MNRNELVAAVAAKHNLPKAEADRILGTLIDTITTTTKTEEIAIHGFGTFSVKEVAAREYKSLFGTGVTEAKRKLVFKPAPALRDIK